MKVRVYYRITGIVWSHEFEGCVYYKDDKDRDWYKLRNQLPEGRTIIVVDSETKRIMTFWKGDPTRVGLHVPKICKMVDVYQIECDMDDKTFFDSIWKFEDDSFIELPRELTPADVEYKKKDILSEYTSIIGVYQDMVDFDWASDKDIEYLHKLKLYRMSVYDVDPEKPIWPEPPVK